MALSIRIGAGGRWPVFDETLAPNVVKQQSKVSCGPACGEMLFRDRGVKITQEIIEQASYVPIEAQVLANVLNQLEPSYTRLWLGGAMHMSGVSDEDLVRELNKTGSWAAVMWERSASIGHLVVIDGFDDHGRLKIRDPWDGTSYTMQMTDFLQVWSGIGLYSRA